MHKPVVLAAALLALSLGAALAQNEPSAPEPNAADTPAAEPATQAIPPPSDAALVDMPQYCAGLGERPRFFPTRALQRLQSGRAVLDCAFDAQDVIQTCQAVQEDPDGREFGEAALAIACRSEGARLLTTNARHASTIIYTPTESNLRHMRWTTSFRIATSH